SDRDDMHGEHWKDASVPKSHRTLRQVRRWSVGHDALGDPMRVVPSPRPVASPGGSGAPTMLQVPVKWAYGGLCWLGLSAPELSFAAQTRREERFVSASPRNH